MVVPKLTSVDEYRKLAKNHTKIAIMFTASWCGPCKMIAPVFEKLSNDFQHSYFAAVDVDEVEDLAKEFNIRAMPTFVVVKNGETLDSLVGASPHGLHRLLQYHGGR